MPTKPLVPPPMARDAAAVWAGDAYVSDIERRLSPYFERSEPRRRAMAYLRGLLSPAERKNTWQLAEVSGDPTPYAFQHLLRRSLWDPEAVRDELRRYVIQQLGDTNAVLVIDETGFPKKGRHSAGVARQYSATASKVENCQIGIFLGYASRLGHTLLDRELYLPEEWTADRPRCQHAGIPADRAFASKPALAKQILQRTLGAGMPARWVTGDRGYGDDRRLRLWLEAQPQAHVLAVSGHESVWVDGRQRPVEAILAALPVEDWIRLSAGKGATAPLWYDWRWLPLDKPPEPDWCRWLLVQQSVSGPPALQAYVIFAPHETPLVEAVRVVENCGTIAQLFDAANAEVGLDHYEVRSWTGWYRHITLAMWALALLTVLQAKGISKETIQKSWPSRQSGSSLLAFKSRQGLGFA